MMTILETEVEISLNPANMNHFITLGYTLPKIENKKGNLIVPRGAKLVVKVNDLNKGSRVELTKICDECGKHIANIPYNAIIRYRKAGNGKDRCFECGQIQGGFSKKNNVPYKKSLEYFAKNENKEYLLTEFSKKNTKKQDEINSSTLDQYLWDCPDCESEYLMRVVDRTHGYNCPYCRGLRVNHTNCLWTTHPEVAEMLVNKQKGYEITAGSEKREDFTCNTCKHVSNKQVKVVTSYGFSCPRCSDGLSYPQKFMYNVLTQCNLQFEREKMFNWSDNKVYDFFISFLDLIIETHGMQHYKDPFEYLGGRSLEEEQVNDNLKERLAIENGIKDYVIIDCSKSELEFIKNNIINSKLNNLLDLSNINWNKCHEYACNTLVKEVSELWNSGMKSRIAISKLLQVGKNTTLKYLKQASEIGWIDYDPKLAIKKVYLKEYKNNKLKGVIN